MNNPGIGGIPSNRIASNNAFIWDVGTGLPQVLQDTKTPDGGGTAAPTTYLYGLSLIAETSSAGTSSYYLSDGLGSSTQLTDTSGAVTDTYAYDVWGAPRAAGPAPTSNDFRFTGQQDDRNANRGLYYLRARHYDPALGRFLGRDPSGAGPSYVYGNSNPVNFADPAGLDPEEAKVRAIAALRKLGDCVKGFQKCIDKTARAGVEVWHHFTEDWRAQDSFNEYCDTFLNRCLLSDTGVFDQLGAFLLMLSPLTSDLADDEIPGWLKPHRPSWWPDLGSGGYLPGSGSEPECPR
jgi:RHS repeat-associated protein